MFLVLRHVTSHLAWRVRHAEDLFSVGQPARPMRLMQSVVAQSCHCGWRPAQYFSVPTLTLVSSPGDCPVRDTYCPVQSTVTHSADCRWPVRRPIAAPLPRALQVLLGSLGRPREPQQQRRLLQACRLTVSILHFYLASATRSKTRDTADGSRKLAGNRQ